MAAQLRPSPIQKTLKKINKILNDYSAEQIAEDMKALEPKDRIAFFLKMTEIAVNNADKLDQSYKLKKQITHVIDFCD